MDAVLRDFESSPLSPAEKALFRFVEHVNASAPSITGEEFHDLRAAGWSDQAVYDAITVCALFNFFNRWVDAAGVGPVSDDELSKAVERMAAGYIRTPETAPADAGPAPRPPETRTSS